MSPSEKEDAYHYRSFSNFSFNDLKGTKTTTKNKILQPSEVYKIVKARQNLLYIQKENSKLKNGNAEESLNEKDLTFTQT